MAFSLSLCIFDLTFPKLIILLPSCSPRAAIIHQKTYQQKYRAEVKKQDTQNVRAGLTSKSLMFWRIRESISGRYPQD
jgi:hypothetical protein